MRRRGGVVARRDRPRDRDGVRDVPRRRDVDRVRAVVRVGQGIRPRAEAVGRGRVRGDGDAAEDILDRHVTGAASRPGDGDRVAATAARTIARRTARVQD